MVIPPPAASKAQLRSEAIFLLAHSVTGRPKPPATGWRSATVIPEMWHIRGRPIRHQCLDSTLSVDADMIAMIASLKWRLSSPVVPALVIDPYVSVSWQYLCGEGTATPRSSSTQGIAKCIDELAVHIWSLFVERNWQHYRPPPLYETEIHIR